MATSPTLDLFPRSDREDAIDALHAATAIYTREHIVDELLGQVRWPQGARRLIDSSCGDGAFLCRALDRLLTQQPGATDGDIQERIAGWEIHAGAAAQARARLADVLVEHGRNRSRSLALAREMVRCADFLTAGPAAGSVDTIVGNPPYLRFLNVPEPLRGEYEGVLPEYAQADLLHSFLDRCADLLPPDGELALVTADRWLFNAGAARLREVVGRRFGLERAERLSVGSTFYRPKQRRVGTPPRIHPVAVVLTALGRGGAPIGRDAIYPGAEVATDAAACTLGDVARVRLAPWLGTPGVFLVSASVARDLPQAHLVPAIDTDDVREGQVGTPKRFALLTRPDQMPPPALLAHLERELHRMCARGRRRAPHWLPPESFHEFDLSEESLLVPRIAKSLCPVRVPVGVLPVNHNLSIVRSGVMSLEQIEALLRSEQATDWVRHHAAPLESGYRSLTTRLLRQLPVFSQ